MKQKSVLIVLFCLSLVGMQAQNTMSVKDVTGNVTQFQINTLHSLTFPNNNLQINKIGGSNSSFLLSNISKLFFENGSVNELKTIDNDLSSLSVFPCPVLDQLNIQYKASSGGQCAIRIIDSNGRMVLQQKNPNRLGVNQIIIDVSFLQQGLYFCSINNGNSIEVSKFIKAK